MDSSLVQAWETAAGNPFLPTVGKQTQFLVASIFLILGFTIAGTFTLSKAIPPLLCAPSLLINTTDRSLVNLPLFAIPSSLAIAYVCPIFLPDRPSLAVCTKRKCSYGTVYMFCAVGVYI